MERKPVILSLLASPRLPALAAGLALCVCGGGVQSTASGRHGPLAEHERDATVGTPLEPGIDVEEAQPADSAEIRRLIHEGHYAEAATRARRLLEQVEASHGRETLPAAEALDLLVEAMWREGRAGEPEAMTLAERAVRIKERALGPQHLNVAVSLTNLGLLLEATGDYRRPKPLFERALSIRERELGPNHPDVASSLTNLAILHYEIDELGPAKQLHERALAIREKALGPDHLDVALSLKNLAILHQDAGNYTDAQSLYERALAIREQTLGREHPLVAGNLTDLATLLDEAGDYGRARRLYERALETYEKTLGLGHPFTASTLANLAFLLRKLGDYAGGAPLYERALDTYERALGPSHPNVAATLNSFADLLRDMGDGARARATYERALAISEGVFDPGHTFVAWSLTGLADLLRETGDDAGAKPLYERALAIREGALGPDHPEVASALSSLADLHRGSGMLAPARSMLERALAIREGVLGPDHPDVARTLVSLAEISLQAGRSVEAFEVALRAEKIAIGHLRLTARALAEWQALSYTSTRARGLDLALSVAAGSQRSDLARRAWEELIRSRSLVLDELGARHREVAVLQRLSRPPTSSREIGTRVEAAFGELAAAREQMANLVVRSPGWRSPEQQRALLDQARRRKEKAELGLADISLSFQEELSRQDVGFAEVTKYLPRGSALLAMVVYNQHGPQARNSYPHSRVPGKEEAGFDPARQGSIRSYLSLVLRGGGGTPSLVSIGPAAEIDTLVSKWKREAARGVYEPDRSPAESETAYRHAGEALRRAVWDPIAPLLTGIVRLFVVPDGALHLVNLSALPVGERGYLMEGGPLIHYLTAERDLIPPRGARRRGDGLLAMGNPHFNETKFYAALKPARRPQASEQGAARAPAGRSYSQAISNCADFGSLRFDNLPGSERETEEIVTLWNLAQGHRQRGGSGQRTTDSTKDTARIVWLTGDRASEAAFKANAAGMRVLHLATHGFFLGGSCSSAPGTTRGIGGVGPASERPKPGPDAENPLLMAGLALAGANYRDAAGVHEEDGILTAEEIAALDLGGVEWAVLSACDTGAGEVRAGEGVFGLRRAFQMAGAGAVIMSLWPVEDESAQRWMLALYEGRLQKGMGTAESVRAASLAMLRRQRAEGKSQHPFYWAPFVAIGEWR